MSKNTTVFNNYLSALKLSPYDPYTVLKRKRGIFHGQHVHTIQVGANKIIDEDQYEKALIKAVLNKNINNGSTASYLSSMSKVGSMQLQRYANAGKMYAKFHKPNIRILTQSVSKDIFKDIIEKDTGKTVNIDKYSLMYMSDVLWCKYKFQQLFNYDAFNDFLLYQNNYYDFSKVVITVDPNSCTCSIKSLDSVNLVTTKMIDVSVQTGAVEDVVTTKEIATHTYSRPSDNKLLKIETQEKVLKVETVPTGSVVAGSSFDSTTTTKVKLTVNTLTRTFAPCDRNTQYYVVEYTPTDEDQTYYWVYDSASNKYPIIDSIQDTQTAITVYPITTIRDYFAFVTGDEKKAANEMLKAIGTDFDKVAEAFSENEHINDIMGCFVVVGFSPSEENDPLVSKALYETVEYVYDTVGFRVNTPYSLEIEQDVYDSSIMWTSASTVEQEENVLPIGTCAHTSVVSTATTSRYMECKGYNKRWISPYLFVADVRINLYEECSTPEAVIYKTLVNSFYVQGIPFSNPAPGGGGSSSDEYEPPAIEGLNLAGDLVFHTGVIMRGYNEDDHMETFSYNAFDLNVRMTFDGKICASNKHTYDTKDSVTTVVKKQINATHTRTYTLLNFVGDMTTEHPGGVSTIALNAKNEELLVPLIKEVMAKFSIFDLTKLLDNIMHFQYYAYSHQYTKWYKTESFLGWLRFMSVCLIIMAPALGLASIPVSANAYFTSIFTNLVISIGVSLALDIIAKHTDGFLQAVLSGAAIAIGVAAGGMINGFNFTDILFILDYAVNAFNLFVGEQVERLQSDYASFTQKAGDRQETFDEKLGLLFGNLSVQDVVDVTVLANDYTNASLNALKFNPDTFIFLGTEAYLVNPNEIFYNSLGSFRDNQLTLTM